MKRIVTLVGTLTCSMALLAGCTYNPFISNNHTTGSATSTLVGAGVGAGTVGLLGGSKPLIAAGGIMGGVVGYYVSTLRYDSGGVIQATGQVYKVGDYVGIYIPTDKLFEVNTADFLPQAGPILDSAATVLERYPNNNIIISGNTSGFSRARWELKLSQKRAQRIAAYFWSTGNEQFQEQSITTRRLRYVGYGDYFPISQTYTNDGIRSNSRIQITSYPTSAELGVAQKQVAENNFGAMEQDDAIVRAGRNLKGEG